MKTRDLLVVFLIASLSILVVYLSFRSYLKESEEDVIKSAVHHAKHNIEQYKELRGYYTKRVISKIKKQKNLKITYLHEDDEQAIPLPATMIHDLSKIMNEKSGYEFKLYSDYPFPNRSSRVLDEFEVRALSLLREDSQETYVEVNTNPGEEEVRVAIADTMQA